ncbi:hypothetical protein BUALT_Bualt19G0020200 [Buddleja alternifolia]|uniref:Cell number regulator 6 n=1 Tax=Buddleja alternifolia TaxID=168488 RepID=A0AAV6W4P8_9LAMI|nr:hypothetical protein BUALT_Bualt19G0020200 [Buddleja alternifolia]
MSVEASGVAGAAGERRSCGGEGGGVSSKHEASSHDYRIYNGYGDIFVMMAERAYVTLTEEQNDLQNITPGELNQPIDLDQLNSRICEHCGQTLPATYTPPADEDWNTGIFGCSEDRDSCLTGLFCPCVLFGHNIATFNEDISSQRACISHAVFIEGGITFAALATTFSGYIDPDTMCLITEGLLFAWGLCAIYTGMGRQSLQRKYHLKDSPCDPCLVHCCLHWCAICQEHREMQNYLSEGALSEDTVVDPPQVQEMNTADNDRHDHGLSSSSRADDEHNNLQLQPV